MIYWCSFWPLVLQSSLQDVWNFTNREALGFEVRQNSFDIVWGHPNSLLMLCGYISLGTSLAIKRDSLTAAATPRDHSEHKGKQPHTYLQNTDLILGKRQGWPESPRKQQVCRVCLFESISFFQPLPNLMVAIRIVNMHLNISIPWEKSMSPFQAPIHISLMPPEKENNNNLSMTMVSRSWRKPTLNQLQANTTKNKQTTEFFQMECHF